MLVRVDGELVATDPELINVVPASHVMGPSGGSIRMGGSATPARRLHAERCDLYADEARKERLQMEMREFNQKNGQPPRAPRRNRGL
jgi:hypothetical protein